MISERIDGYPSGHAVCLHDLEFDEVPVLCRSIKGARYTRWARVGMPRIPDRVIDCTFFLYKTREDAIEGKDPEGTGFIVQTATNLYTGYGTHYYGVTNWHVACQLGASVIRLNADDGGVDIIEYGPEDWTFKPNGPDVAVVPIDVNPYSLKTSSISISLFTRRPALHWGKEENVYVGDDVFMLGLFVDHAGRTTNVPNARFGNISTLPSVNAPIRQPTGFNGESYVIDMHSRTGFSGSPVFVYRTLGGDLGTYEHQIDELFFEKDTGITTIKFRPLFQFLGIHWGQFPEAWELRSKKEISESRKPHLITKGAYVEGMSGMTCVIPTWDIEEVLKLPKLQKKRTAEESNPFARNRLSTPRAEGSTSKSDSPAKEDNPSHEADFNRLRDAAAQTPKSDDQT